MEMYILYPVAVLLLQVFWTLSSITIAKKIQIIKAKTIYSFSATRFGQWGLTQHSTRWSPVFKSENELHLWGWTF